MKGASKNVEYDIQAMFGVKRNEMTPDQLEHALELTRGCERYFWTHQQEQAERYDYNIQFAVLAVEATLEKTALELSQAIAEEERLKIEQAMEAQAAADWAEAEKKRVEREHAAAAEAEKQEQAATVAAEVKRQLALKAAEAEEDRLREREAAEKAQVEEEEQLLAAGAKAEAEARLAEAAENERRIAEKALEAEMAHDEIAAARVLYKARIDDLGLPSAQLNSQLFISVDKVPRRLMSTRDFPSLVYHADGNADVRLADDAPDTLAIRTSQPRPFPGVGLITGTRLVSTAMASFPTASS